MANNMTTGSPSRALFLFALPMVFGNLFQQMYTIADSIFVGKFVGADALAAVGATNSLCFLFISVATGTGIGASILISQLFGAGQKGKMKTTIYTALISVFLLSILLTVLGVLLNKPILRLMNTPDDIFPNSAIFLHIYFLGLVFLFMFNVINSIFNALGESKVTLCFLIFASLLNIGLDVLFVVKLQMGVRGAAFATLIAQGVCAALSFIYLNIRLKEFKEYKDFSYFDLKTVKSIATLAIPSVIQQSTVSIGMMLVQSLVNSFGSVVVAGYTAATRIDSIAIMPMVNVGSAMSTFTAQNIGARKLERIPKGLRTSIFMIFVMSLIITGAVFLWGQHFIGAFLNSSADPGVITVGLDYLRVVSVCYVVMGAMNIYNGVLRGAGDMKGFLFITFINHLTRVSCAYLSAPFLGAGAIWWALPTGWFVSLVAAYVIYKRGSWKNRCLV